MEALFELFPFVLENLGLDFESLRQQKEKRVLRARLCYAKLLFYNLF